MVLLCLNMLFRTTHVHIRQMFASTYIHRGLSWLSFQPTGLCGRQAIWDGRNQLLLLWGCLCLWTFGYSTGFTGGKISSWGHWEIQMPELDSRVESFRQTVDYPQGTEADLTCLLAESIGWLDAVTYSLSLHPGDKNQPGSCRKGRGLGNVKGAWTADKTHREIWAKSLCLCLSVKWKHCPNQRFLPENVHQNDPFSKSNSK